MANNTLEFSDSDLAQMQRFNRKLAWLPRFRIRNRLTPRLVQGLLRASQIVSADKPVKHDLQAQNTVVYSQGASVPVRIIRPQGNAQGVVLDYHGGGWVIGNAQMNDDLNIAMVKDCNVAVVSVDYRLAVDTPVEGLMEDCLCAARWLLSDDCTEFAGLPVIVVGDGFYGWSGYQATIRTVQSGAGPVMWLRGGEEALAKARYPIIDRRIP